MLAMPRVTPCTVWRVPALKFDLKFIPAFIASAFYASAFVASNNGRQQRLRLSACCSLAAYFFSD